MTQKKRSLFERAAGIGDDLVVTPKENREVRNAPSQLGAFRGVLAEKDSELAVRDAEIAKLTTQLAERPVGRNKYPMNRLHVVPGRERFLTEEQFKELLENLRVNEMDTPLSIVKRPDGDWDIVSGSNRYKCGKILGWAEVEAEEKDYTPEQADVLAFYSNLMHPSLTDYEKYIGCKRRMLEKGLDQTAIASESGLSKMTVSRLMAFDKLPEAALSIIVKNPSKIGANAVVELARLAEEGRAPQVIEAVESIIEKDADQGSSVAIAAGKKLPPKEAKDKPKKPEPVKHRVGKTVFAQVMSTGKYIRVDVSNEDDREEIEREINSAIEKIIELRKKKDSN